MAVVHKSLTGDEAIHEIMYVASSDPGAVGANKFWLDTTGGATLQAGAILKQRNGANSGWTTRADLSALTAGASITTLTDGATVTWTVTGKREDMAQLTIAGARTLAISGASAGFRGALHITESGSSRSLALPASSIVANTGAGAIALTGSSGGKQKWTVSYDGTNYWWEAGADYT